MQVEDIINDWDPINLFPFAPIDEYHTEIDAVKRVLSTCPCIDNLTDEIIRIFYHAFGDTFEKSRDECFVIAGKLLSLVN